MLDQKYTKNVKIALLCPTRNRINKLLTFISSIITTASTCDNIIIVLGIDSSDPIRKKYNYLNNNIPNIQIVEFMDEGKFIGLSNMWNKMAASVDADIYAMVGDDMVFVTTDWDRFIIEEFNEQNCPPDKIKMVHCNDGMRGNGNKYSLVAPLCVNFFVHKKYIDTVGYFVEPYMLNTHHDTWIQLIFDKIKRTTYRHDILIKHLHYSQTDQQQDMVSTNLEKLRENIWNNNEWIKTYSSEIQNELNKLKSVIKNEN